ncbi:MAG: pseudouridine synthase [Flavobacteriaceae bacterium]|nr:pseudouridine synthase [Flavobacteriaceae bacterium]
MNQIIHRHFILYKPFGYLSQFVNNQTKRTNKKLLGQLFDFPERTMAIGRLDEKSEGLLLLTTDGKTSDLITGKKIEKEYYVQLDGDIDAGTISKLASGIDISIPAVKSGSGIKKYHTKPCKVFKINEVPSFPERSKKIRDERHGPTSWISITLTEGKFRQIRKMTSAVGYPTLRLVRFRIGNIFLNDLKTGQLIEKSSLIDIV